MIDQITFDTTDANTIADSHKILSGMVSSSDGATLITDTAGSGATAGKQGLDVFLINPSVDVNLQAGDGTDITQTGGALDVNLASGNLTINEEDIYTHGAAFTSGTDKGSFILATKQSTLAADANVQDGDFAAFKVDADGELYVTDEAARASLASIDSALGGTLTVAVTGDVNVTQGTSPWVVSATDLDIRSLDHTSGGANDSVRLGDGTSFITSTLVGSDQALDVNVVNDTAVSDVANTAISATAVSTAATATDLAATDLADRKYAYVYNNGNRRIFVGDSGVTTATGFPVTPRGYVQFRVGAAIDLHAISAGGTQDTRFLQLS